MKLPLAMVDPEGEAVVGECSEYSDSLADSALFAVLASARVFLVFLVFLVAAAFPFEPFPVVEVLPPAALAAAASRCSARVVRFRSRL